MPASGLSNPPTLKHCQITKILFAPVGPHLISPVSFLQNQNHHFKPFKHLFLGYFIRNEFASPSKKTSPSPPLSSVKNYPALLLGILPLEKKLSSPPSWHLLLLVRVSLLVLADHRHRPVCCHADLVISSLSLRSSSPSSQSSPSSPSSSSQWST